MVCFLRFMLPVMIIAAFCCSTPAQSDTIERIRDIRRQADNRADQNVREAIANADKLTATLPATALKTLKKSLLDLDLSSEISAEKRKELVDLLQTKIDVLEGRRDPITREFKDSKQTAKAAPLTPEKKAELKKKLEGYNAESKEIRDAIIEVERLMGNDRYAQAQKRIIELSQRYPDSPAIIALSGQGRYADRIDAARQLVKEQSDRVVFALNNVEKSSLPAVGDQEYPPGWREKMEQRRKRDMIQLSKEDEEILKSLEMKVKSAVNNGPFEETLQNLSNMIDKPIYIDKKSLEDLGKDMRTPVSYPADVSARTALRAMLQAQGLTFIIREKTLQVVTLERARESLVSRAYYMGDLISVNNTLPGGSIVWGANADIEQTTKNAQVIIESIKQSIDPLTWKEKGGTSSVGFHFPSLSIIVTAPAEVHAALGGKLGR